MTLEDDPFGYRVTKDGRVLVSRGGRLVKVVAGAAADQLVARLGHDDMTDQGLLARVTGNYRRGNERDDVRPDPPEKTRARHGARR